MKKVTYIRNLIFFLKREKLYRLLLILLVLILLSSGALALIEKISLFNALWLSIVTLTTVGYGDITPHTIAGKFIGVLTMLFGIGILGMFTASIASVFVDKKLKEDRGMRSYDFNNHIIICTWNHNTYNIIQELRSDARVADASIVLLADLQSKPLDDANLYFIKGKVNEENLKRANIEQAQTVIILGEDEIEATARDAQVVLATLAVEALNPNVYSIVELQDEANEQHCQRANADEIIVGSEFSCRLISRAALDHGISKIISELLSSRHGDEIYKIPVPKLLNGKKFIDVFSYMKQENNSIVLGIQKGLNNEVISNPNGDLIMENNDYLIVIAKNKPEVD